MKLKGKITKLEDKLKKADHAELTQRRKLKDLEATSSDMMLRMSWKIDKLEHIEKVGQMAGLIE